jgi:hypothetical protein
MEGLLLQQDARFEVPPSVQRTRDGLHAEIRIEQTKGWGPKTHEMPTGTKYPCMGCALYFDSKGHVTAVRMGPMWITTPGVSTQLKGGKIGKLTDQQVHEVAQRLLVQFKRAAIRAQMGHSKQRDGEYTVDNTPDSGSDIDPAEFPKLKERMLKVAGDHSYGKAAKPKASRAHRADPTHAKKKHNKPLYDDDDDYGGADAPAKAAPVERLRRRGPLVDDLCARIRELGAGQGDMTQFWRGIDKGLYQARGNLQAQLSVIGGLDREQMWQWLAQAKIDHALVLGYEDALRPEELLKIIVAVLWVLNPPDGPGMKLPGRREDDDEDRGGHGRGSSGLSLTDPTSQEMAYT